jgi:hypothetical protein
MLLCALLQRTIPTLFTISRSEATTPANTPMLNADAEEWQQQAVLQAAAAAPHQHCLSTQNKNQTMPKPARHALHALSMCDMHNAHPEHLPTVHHGRQPCMQALSGLLRPLQALTDCTAAIKDICCQHSACHGDKQSASTAHAQYQCGFSAKGLAILGIFHRRQCR